MTDLKDLQSIATENDITRSTKIKNYARGFSNPQKYFGNNSLGLLPEGFEDKLELHSSIWKNKQHHGHFYTDGTKNFRPWWLKQEQLCDTGSKLIGCKNDDSCPEIAFGNGGLSVNNRLILEDFLQYIRDEKGIHMPTILTISTNFPSDDVGLKSSAKRIFGKKFKLIEFEPKNKETGLYDFDELVALIKNLPNLQMGFFPGLCYSSGQRFPIQKLTETLHSVGAVAGFDLAHSVGNYQLQLHDWKVDFATFCGYKYLNGGPGSISGFYVHEDWFLKSGFADVSGWFGIHPDDRFRFNPQNFRPAPGARRMLLSNDLIFSMLALEASFESFEKCGIENIFSYHKQISTFLYQCLECIPQVQIITPKAWEERGCQISFKSTAGVDDLLKHLIDDGKFFCEKRKEDIIRVTPVASTSFTDVYNFVEYTSNFFIN